MVTMMVRLMKIYISTENWLQIPNLLLFSHSYYGLQAMSPFMKDIIFYSSCIARTMPLKSHVIYLDTIKISIASVCQTLIHF